MGQQAGRCVDYSDVNATMSSAKGPFRQISQARRCMRTQHLYVHQTHAALVGEASRFSYKYVTGRLSKSELATDQVAAMNLAVLHLVPVIAGDDGAVPSATATAAAAAAEASALAKDDGSLEG